MVHHYHYSQARSHSASENGENPIIDSKSGSKWASKELEHLRVVVEVDERRSTWGTGQVGPEVENSLPDILYASVKWTELVAQRVRPSGCMKAFFQELVAQEGKAPVKRGDAHRSSPSASVDDDNGEPYVDSSPPDRPKDPYEGIEKQLEFEVDLLVKAFHRVLSEFMQQFGKRELHRAPRAPYAIEWNGIACTTTPDFYFYCHDTRRDLFVEDKAKYNTSSRYAVMGQVVSQVVALAINRKRRWKNAHPGKRLNVDLKVEVVLWQAFEVEIYRAYVTYDLLRWLKDQTSEHPGDFKMTKSKLFDLRIEKERVDFFKNIIRILYAKFEDPVDELVAKDEGSTKERLDQQGLDEEESDGEGMNGAKRSRSNSMAEHRTAKMLRTQ